jgi:hypothetical protein
VSSRSAFLNTPDCIPGGAGFTSGLRIDDGDGKGRAGATGGPPIGLAPAGVPETVTSKGLESGGNGGSDPTVAEGRASGAETCDSRRAILRPWTIRIMPSAAITTPTIIDRTVNRTRGSPMGGLMGSGESSDS